MRETRDYYIVDKKEWHQYLSLDDYVLGWHLTREQLDQLISVNDYLTLEEATEVYEPIAQLIMIHLKHYLALSQERDRFMGIERPQKPPFIIGISGSVAVGKSTTARLLQVVLSQLLTQGKVDLITTDGFIYPNAELERRGILDRKGFPESYDMARLRDFLVAVKNNESNIQVPRYSHDHYDIIPGEFDVIDHPKVLIIEGINVLQTSHDDAFFVGDYADLSIYVDAKTEDIESWFLKRSKLLIDAAKDDPDNYYYAWSQKPLAEQEAYIRAVWQEINLPNLEQYILPTRNHADILIHKQADHAIDSLWIKKR